MKITRGMMVGIVMLCSTVVKAEESDGWQSSGFAFGTWTGQEGSDGTARIGHVWLIEQKQLDDDLKAKIVLTPEGPPKMVHNAQLMWSPKNDVGVKQIEVGRFIAPFGREWAYTRIDNVATVSYSAIFAPAVARENGIAVHGKTRSTNWDAGIFYGDRIGGNIANADDSKTTEYIRLRQEFGKKLSIGASRRFGPVGASGFDAQFASGKFKLTLESVASQDISQWYALGERQVGKHTAVLRYEDLKGGEQRWTTGARVKISGNREVKINAVVSNTTPDKIVGQFIQRW